MRHSWTTFCPEQGIEKHVATAVNGDMDFHSAQQNESPGAPSEQSWVLAQHALTPGGVDGGLWQAATDLQFGARFCP